MNQNENHKMIDQDQAQKLCSAVVDVSRAKCCLYQVTALSAAFERAPPPAVGEERAEEESAALVALLGLERCAALVARLAPDSITLDTLVLTLCKFTGLLSPQYPNYIAIGELYFIFN